jgi:hypothetical protein
VDRHARGPGLRFQLSVPGHRGSLCIGPLEEIFVKDFVAAWNKIINLDRYELHKA